MPAVIWSTRSLVASSQRHHNVLNRWYLHEGQTATVTHQTCLSSILKQEPALQYDKLQTGTKNMDQWMCPFALHHPMR